jgi:hypothetical protein
VAFEDRAIRVLDDPPEQGLKPDVAGVQAAVGCVGKAWHVTWSLLEVVSESMDLSAKDTLQ